MDRLLAAAIKCYRLQNLPVKKVEQEYFRSKTSLESTIDSAGFAVDHRGKRYGHQSRIKIAAMKQIHTRLHSNLKDIRGATNFDRLMQALSTLIDLTPRIKGLGELYRYDTALRIGWNVGLEPDRVYLHAGTRKGAKNFGLPWKQTSLERSELPVALQDLRPLEVEDILCIYKDRFTQ